MKKVIFRSVVLILLGTCITCKSNEDEKTVQKVNENCINMKDEKSIKTMLSEYIEVRTNMKMSEHDLIAEFYSKDFWSIAGEALLIIIFEDYRMQKIVYMSDKQYGQIAYAKVVFSTIGSVDEKNVKYYKKEKTLTFGLIKENGKIKILGVPGETFLTQEGLVKFIAIHKNDTSIMYKRVSENIEKYLNNK